MENKSLYKTMDEILWNDWDPLGVNEFDGARDEYYDYISKVVEMKTEKGSVEDIANYLHKIEIELMEVSGNFENCKRVAEKILSLP